MLAAPGLTVLAPAQALPATAAAIAPRLVYTAVFDAMATAPAPPALETTPGWAHTLHFPLVVQAGSTDLAATASMDSEPVNIAPVDPALLDPASLDTAGVPTLEDNGVTFYRQWHLEAQDWPAADPALPLDASAVDAATEQGTIPATPDHPRFVAPVWMAVEVSDLVAQGVDMTMVQLWTRPDAIHDWRPVRGARYDAVRQVFVAWLTHFSDFGLGIAPSAGGELLPSLHGASSDLQTGAATFSYPIRTPAGLGGLNPNLSLNYSSIGPNDLYMALDSDSESRKIQSSVIGYGWSLGGLNTITRIQGEETDSDYLLLFNGQSYDLNGSGTDGTGFYDTNPISFMAIDFTDNSTTSTWRIKTRDGTLYEFGGAPQESWPSSDPGERAAYVDWNFRVNNTIKRHEIVTWYLRRVEDAQGNSIEYNYLTRRGTLLSSSCEPSSISGDKKWYTLSTRLDTITWGSNTGKYGAAVAPTLRVEFGYGSRSDANAVKDGCQPRRSGARLASLYVQYWPTDSSGWQLLRQYNLTASYPSGSHSDFIRHLQLAGITEYGKLGASGAALRTYTFTYVQRLDGDSQDTENNIRLNTISNGEGGKITYSYTEQHPDCKDGDALCHNNHRWLVSKTHLEDGLGNTYDTTYTYDTTLVSTYGEERLLYMGASQVRKMTYAPNSSSIVRYEWNVFHRGDLVHPSALLGKLRIHQVFDVEGGTLYADTRYKWGAWDRSGATDSFFAVEWLNFGNPRWVRLEQQDEWVQGQVSQQILTYDLADQGGKQFGNVTTLEERAPDAAYLARDVWEAALVAKTVHPLRRTTQTQYFPNSSGPATPELTYIVDRPARALVKDSSGACQAETRTIYADLNPSTPNQNRDSAYTSLPQTPLAVKTERVLSGCPYGPTSNRYDANLLVTGYGYDVYGNHTFSVDYGDTSDQNIRIDTTYDSFYHLFPIKQKYTGNADSWNIEESAEYHGVNSGNGNSSFSFWGEPASTCLPNDICTRFAYDSYGRLTRRWEAIAESANWSQQTDANATLQYGYFPPGAFPGQQTYITTEWRAPRCYGTLTRRHYNGLGQLVMEQHTDQNWQHPVEGCGSNPANKQEIRTRYQYNALGSVIRTSVPHLRSFDSWLDLAIDWNTTPSTRTDYNPIGRIVRSVVPNGEQTDTSYLGRAGSVITAAQYNAPTRVIEWWEQHPLGYPKLARTYSWNGSSWVVLSQVQLSYSVTGNLLSVTYPGSLGTSTYSYDQAGRRTAMNDIDLGSWSYDYNRLSQLVRRRDARNQYLCFYADAIGRPLARYDNGTTATCPLTAPTNSHVRYSYDGGHNAGVAASRGLLTQVMLREGSGAATWSYTRALSYNAQGLPASETVSYPNSVSFTTQTGYDAYLRPFKLTYSDGEILEAEYNGMGLVKKLSVTPSGGSKQALVDSVSYNEAGLLTALRLPIGGVLWRTQLYYPWNAASAESNARLMHIRVGTTNDPNNDASHNKLWLGYQYEGFGNVRVLFEGSNNSTVVANPVSYDVQSRLLSAYGGSFGFDAVNRMNAFEGRGYSYGATHPQALLASSKSGTPTLDFTYDANGNLTQRQYLDSSGVEQSQTLAWDAANLLRTLTQGSTVESYWYDEAGQRVRKQRGSVVSYYPNRTHEREGSVTTQLYYLGEMPIALRQVGTSSYTYLHSDQVGSVVLTTQGTSITASRFYRAYGAKRSGNDFAFERNYTGQHLDDTGLLYYGARYYDPAAGRFISPDTLVPDPGNVLDYNRYLYARGNPLKYNDPSGHWVESALDVAFIGYDLYDIQHNGLNWENGLSLAADVGGLALPLIAGGGLVVRGISHSDDAFKAAKAANEVQNAFEAVEVADEVYRTTDLLAIHFTRAAEFGIDTANDLQKVTKGQDLQVHHIVEKRFADTLMLKKDDMLSVVLTREEHQVFTKAWRNEIGYNLIDKGVTTTSEADRETIWKAAQKIYQGYPELLEATRITLGME